MRIAPCDGYNFGNKRQWRRRVWRFFADSFSRHVAGLTAFLMPSSEGGEIEAALNVGFHQSNLFVCDSEPAIIARLKRRFPLINTIGLGVPADEAFARIGAAGVSLDCISLDLTGCVSKSTLTAIGASGVVRGRTCVAVNVLRGREKGISNRYLKLKAVEMSSDVDSVRRAAVGVCLRNYGPNRIFWPNRGRDRFTYRSVAGNQTMLTTLWEVHALKCRCHKCLSVLDQESGIGECFVRTGGPNSRVLDIRNVGKQTSWREVEALLLRPIA